jgi:hypothetical protein
MHSGVYVALAAIAASVMCLIVESHQPNLLLGVVLRVIFEPVLFLSDFSVHLLFPRERVAHSRTEAQVFSWIFVTYSGILGFALGVLGGLAFRRKNPTTIPRSRF